MHVLITCKYQKDQIKSNQEVMETPFSPLEVDWGNFKTFKGDISMVGGPFWLKFGLLHIMHVLYIRIKMDHIDSNREKWQQRLFRRSMAANSVVHGRIWPNFKLIKALMYVFISRSGVVSFGLKKDQLLIYINALKKTFLFCPCVP